MAETIRRPLGSTTGLVLVPISKIKPHPFQSLIPPQTPDEYAAMKADIAQRGIQEPLTITDAGVLLGGHHRWRAATELGLIEVEVKIVTGLSPDEEIIHLVQDNIQRRHLKPAQLAALITHPKVAPIFDAVRKQARQRQVEGGRAGGKTAGRGRSKDRVEEIVPQASGRRRAQARDALGRVAGVSGKLVDAAQLVWTKAPDRWNPF